MVKKENSILKKAFQKDFMEAQKQEKNAPTIVYNSGILSSVPKDADKINQAMGEKKTEKATDVHYDETKDNWKSIGTSTISNEGNETVVTINPPEKDTSDKYSIDGLDQNEIVKVITGMLKKRVDYMDILNRAKDCIYYKTYKEK